MLVLKFSSFILTKHERGDSASQNLDHGVYQTLNELWIQMIFPNDENLFLEEYQ